jgi:hypothetical protein
MLHGMGPNGTGLANTVVLVSLLRELFEQGLINDSDVHAWLNNALAIVKADKVPGQKRDQAISIIERELLPLFAGS